MLPVWEYQTQPAPRPAPRPASPPTSRPAPRPGPRPTAASHFRGRLSWPRAAPPRPPHRRGGDATAGEAATPRRGERSAAAAPPSTRGEARTARTGASSAAHAAFREGVSPAAGRRRSRPRPRGGGARPGWPRPRRPASSSRGSAWCEKEGGGCDVGPWPIERC